MTRKLLAAVGLAALMASVFVADAVALSQERWTDATPYGLFFNNYDPSFYTGFVPRAQDRRRIVGEPLPDLRLPTIDGEKTVRLADLSGEKVLLIEFASW